jgi:hypothetical protein
VDSRLHPQGRGEGSSREGEEGNECVRTDALTCPRTVKTRPRGKPGRGRTSRRRPRMSGRNGRPVGNFYRRTSVI